jgi:hypothetical protein
VLKGAYLYAGEWGPDELINWCAQVLNPNRLLKGEAQRLAYDDGRLIRDQILALDTLTRVTRDGLVVGSPADSAEAVVRCLSVRNYPKTMDLAAMGGADRRLHAGLPGLFLPLPDHPGAAHPGLRSPPAPSPP